MSHITVHCLVVGSSFKPDKIDHVVVGVSGQKKYRLVRDILRSARCCASSDFHARNVRRRTCSGGWKIFMRGLTQK